MFYKSTFYKSMFYKSTFYKSMFYKSTFYKSMFYKSTFYKSMFYKSSFLQIHVLQIHVLQIHSMFYKSTPCFTNPLQSTLLHSTPCFTICRWIRLSDSRTLLNLAVSKFLVTIDLGTRFRRITTRGAISQIPVLKRIVLRFQNLKLSNLVPRAFSLACNYLVYSLSSRRRPMRTMRLN